MSADLLAAFGEPQSPPQVQPQPQSQSQFQHQPTTSGLILEPASQHQPSQPIALRSQNEQDWILQSRPLPSISPDQKEENLWRRDGTGADVLFDASDDDRVDDDFGDFEQAPVQINKSVEMRSPPAQNDGIDLLGLGAALPVSSSNQSSASTVSRPTALVSTPAPSSTSHRFGQHTSLQHTTSRDHNRTTNTHDLFGHHDPAPKTMTLDDDWGNFEDVEADKQQLSPQLPIQPHKPPKPTPASPSQQNQPSRNTETDDEEWDTFEDGPSSLPTQHSSAPTPPIPKERPTNIPPPSTLLTLLPQIHTTLHTASQPIPSNPNNLSTLAHQIQTTHATTARILTGRTHRWKRDPHLSQLFRISAAGRTGMKLTTLDRSTTTKETQDAAEALSSWQRHSAALAAVVTKAKSPALARLSANMRLRTAVGPGVLSAREPCAVCGLKRNERVSGLDDGVDDTFGEFWAEFWGHRACAEFWYRYEGLLERR